jgi:hypothetical protein
MSKLLARARATLTAAATQTLPGTGTRAILMLALFAAVQLADAVFTAVGVTRFGIAAEANPLIAYFMKTWGVGVGLALAESIALTAGRLLHLCAQHLIVAMLTVLFVFAAVIPWAWALAI